MTTRSDTKTTVAPPRLEQAVQALLVAAGCSSDHAALVARSVVDADMKGIDGHGCIRVPTYLDRLLRGQMEADAEPTLVESRGALSWYDGHNGIGQVTLQHVVDEVLSMVDEQGATVAFVRHSNHAGACGYFTEQIARRGYFGVLASNTAPLMPAWNGKAPKLGSNPISFAASAGPDLDPILLDMATSNVSKGKILSALAAGAKSIPDTWAFAADGSPTTDPTEAAQGTLQPMGGPKGYGLALMIEVLTAIIGGSAMMDEIPSMYSTEGGAQNIGHFVLVLDASRGESPYDYFDRLAVLARKLTDEPGVLLPGQPEFRRREACRADGVAISETTLENLRARAAELQLDLEI